MDVMTEIQELLGSNDIILLHQRPFEDVEADVRKLQRAAETSPNREKLLSFAFSLLLLNVSMPEHP